MRIGILGATSQIAKGLIVDLPIISDCELVLYARDMRGVSDFLKVTSVRTKGISICNFEQFGQENLDVIVNCVGIGTPNKLTFSKAEIFMLTEKFDLIAIEYLKRNPDGVYINFSSGAVYGTSFGEAVGRESSSVIDVNDIRDNDYYRIAKINSEAKHRACGYRIVDLRVFNYFNQYLDLSSDYFISQLLMAVKNKSVFTTSTQDIVRDYVHPADLAMLVMKCATAGNMNTAVDVYSSCPVWKSEILEYFKTEYTLQISYKDIGDQNAATGNKNVYYSTYHYADALGYKPKYTAMETIKQISGLILR